MDDIFTRPRRQALSCQTTPTRGLRRMVKKGKSGGGSSSGSLGVVKPQAAVKASGGGSDGKKASEKAGVGGVGAGSEEGGGKGGDFDLDALFSKGKAVKKVKDAEAAAEAAAAAEKEKGKEKDRVLLPGQKKKKGKRENPEFVPVAAPRRFEDGLPVYKSYGDFSDMSCGQVAPKDKPPGKCPFDCWCCF